MWPTLDALDALSIVYFNTKSPVQLRQGLSLSTKSLPLAARLLSPLVPFWPIRASCYLVPSFFPLPSFFRTSWFLPLSIPTSLPMSC
jgi:hypothetical protein